MNILISLFLVAVSCGIIHREHGRWYEYIGVAILGLLVWFGLTVAG